MALELNEFELLKKAASFAKDLTTEEFQSFLKQVKEVVNKQSGSSHVEKIKKIKTNAKKAGEDENTLSSELEALFEDGTLGCKVLMHYIYKYIPKIIGISNMYPELDKSDFIFPAYFAIKSCLIRYCPEEKSGFATIDTVIYQNLCFELKKYAHNEKLLIKIPERKRNNYFKMCVIFDKLSDELERNPFPNEILDSLNKSKDSTKEFTLKEVEELLNIKKEVELVEIDSSYNSESEDTFIDSKLASESDEDFLNSTYNAKYIFEKVESELRKTVSERDLDIFLKCELFDMSGEVVAHQYGMSRQRVNIIKNNVSNKFKQLAKEYYGKN